MPAPQAPLRSAEKTFSYRQRFHLLRVMFQKQITEGRVVLSVLEKKLPPPHYTICTLEALAPYCRTQPVIVIGGDQAAKLSLWHRAQDLLTHYCFIIFSRAQNSVTALQGMRYEVVSDFSYDISSTKLRDQLAPLAGAERFRAALAIAAAAGG